jgi:hypothetical protein
MAADPHLVDLDPFGLVERPLDRLDAVLAAHPLDLELLGALVHVDSCRI